jgi:hypothetical protein
VTYQIPSWLLENGVREWVTDVRPKIAIIAGPTIVAANSDEPERAGWYAALDVPPFPDHLWDCDHLHDTPDDAYFCALAELNSRLGLS